MILKFTLSLLTASLALTPALHAGDLADRITAVIERPEYRHATWGLLVVDAESGQTVFAHNPDQLFIPASTTKLYSCSAALAALGPDHCFETTVVRHGNTLILVASGDPTLGGRTRPDGSLAFTDHDHTYADSTSTETRLTDTDPLAGLNDLARQVHGSGISKIDDVLVDDRLFERSQSSGSGPRRVCPICVNDNVIDFLIEPAAGDEPARVSIRPETAYVRWKATVTSAEPSAKTDVAAIPVGPRNYLVRGRASRADRQLVRIAEVDDPAAFARCLFIEALRRHKVEVAADPAARSATDLPPADAVRAAAVVARFRSPPLSELVKVTLKVSHNLYASTLPSLIAVKQGKRTAADGLRWQGEFLKQLGIPADMMSFAGGAGGMAADLTAPRATVELLRAMRNRPEYPAIYNGLPILGMDGTLATAVPADSPARGHVRAKTGTLGYTDFLNGRLVLRSKALAGVMTTADRRELVFAFFVNNVPLPPGETSRREGRVMGRLCEILFCHQ